MLAGDKQRLRLIKNHVIRERFHYEVNNSTGTKPVAQSHYYHDALLAVKGGDLGAGRRRGLLGNMQTDVK